jgi:threonine-phosphate decarboxylase
MDEIKNHGKLNSGMIHGGDIYTARERLSCVENPPEILDFSANINPLGLPEGVREAIRDAACTFDIYPDPLCRELVRGLAGYEGVPEGWILCGNGAADLIYRTAYAVSPKKAMVLSPTFAEYEEALQAASCEVVHYRLREEDGFQAGEGLLEALDERLDMLFLCNPNNPTGRLLTKEFLHKILLRCKECGILLFLDECFNDFLEEPQEYSAKEFLKEFENLLILKAFTKIYAMAGIRFGHCMSSNSALLKKLKNAGQPWSVSTPAQIAGLRAMEETEYLADTKVLIREERDYLVPQLEKHGIRVIESNANYIFVNDPSSAETRLHEALFGKGILIRNCDNYRGLGPGYYRICIRNHEDNVKLIEAISSVKNIR